MGVFAFKKTNKQTNLKIEKNIKKINIIIIIKEQNTNNKT
jgi:hypothetical protein